MCQKADLLAQNKPIIPTPKKRELNKIKNHKQRWKVQSKYFYSSIKQINLDTIKIIQDFFLLDLNNMQGQTLVLVVYIHNTSYPENIEKKYYFFISDENTGAHDFYVGRSIYNLLFSRSFFKDFKFLTIWSDGGRKHFKCSLWIKFITLLQKRSLIRIEYNFYERYHGHSACDAVANICNFKIKEYQGNTNVIINTSQKAADLLNTIENFTAEVMPPIDRTVFSSKTIKGIDTFYKFFYADGYMQIYDSSDSKNAVKAIPYASLM
jgi:hypothetical protein